MHEIDDLKSKIRRARERAGTLMLAAIPIAALPLFDVAADTGEMTTVLIGLMIAIIPLLIIMKLFTNVFDGFGK